VVNESGSNVLIPVRRETKTPSKPPIVSLGEKLYPHCSVLVGFRNRLKCDLHVPKCFFHSFTEINLYKLLLNFIRFLLSLSLF